MPRPHPTPRQAEIRDAPELSLLALAPAGCGKTEALALRVQGLIDRGQAAAPGRVLVVTFTNRARDNIKARLRAHLRADHMRDLVTVTNFHGLAARLIRAHGNVIGVTPEIEFPTNDWVSRVCRDDLGLKWDALDAVSTALRRAKDSARTDEEVLIHLRAVAGPHALRVEERRQAESRLTHDDLLRLAELILANDEVASLYQHHFDTAIVDEFQDLTPQQFRVIERIAGGRTTYAGDLAQGIYTFAGADPEWVLAQIRLRGAREVVFTESHRSSPAVLDLVNALAPTVGGLPLTCAAPDSWPGHGVGASLAFDDRRKEANWIHTLAKNLLKLAPTHRVAVVTRYQGRRSEIDQAFEADATLSHYRWDMPFIDQDVLRILRETLRRADETAALAAPTLRDYLWSLSGADHLQDPEVRAHLDTAIAWAADRHRDGEPFAAIAARLRPADSKTVLTEPGVHLLNGHLGKGQQFEWVVAAGLEEGSLPFFKAATEDAIREEARVLSVMMSRARHGVVLTRVHHDNGWSKAPSRFLAPIEAVPACRSGDELVGWLNGADWEALAARDGGH